MKSSFLLSVFSFVALVLGLLTASSMVMCSKQSSEEVNYFDTEVSVLPSGLIDFSQIPENIDSFIGTRLDACKIELPADMSADFRNANVLKPRIVVLFIDPYENYKHVSSAERIVDSLVSHFSKVGIEPVLAREERIVEPRVWESYASYKNFMRAYSKDDAYYLFVFPEGSRFREEISPNGIRTHYIKGSSITIPSHHAFVREEFAITGIPSHELSHCFGLEHIFSSEGKEENFGFSCTTGDRIADTPAVQDGTVYFYEDGNCGVYTLDTIPGTSRPNAYPAEFAAIIVENVVSYADPNCLNKFTDEQGKAMRFELLQRNAEKLDNERFEIDYSERLFSN